MSLPTAPAGAVETRMSFGARHAEETGRSACAVPMAAACPRPAIGGGRGLPVKGA